LKEFPVRLSTFIRANMEVILQEWENFAQTLNPLRSSERPKLRDHAQQMLYVICTDLDTYQGEHDAIEKSKGNAPAVAGDTAAEIHASSRVHAGFVVEELVAEYRAMRASVLRLWQNQTSAINQLEVADMLRFNEAVDQSLTESVGRFSSMVRESQNVFMAILGHDVRNPLGAISMGAQILQCDTALPANHQKVAASIVASTNRVNELVGDLLDFSTSHLGGGIPIKPAAYALGPQCELVIGEMRAFHPTRQILLDMSGNLDVVWDRARINQALSNLVGNAVQHGAAGEPIAVTAHGADEVVITVQNMGGVIDAAGMRTIFDPSKRFAMRPASQRNHASNDNLGLGLYITREIVNAHGGHIALCSSEREGTTFTLTLPRASSVD
jgi:signal transduction histidine kinase